jgi:SAM-dependent methyltransferase
MRINREGLGALLALARAAGLDASERLHLGIRSLVVPWDRIIGAVLDAQDGPAPGSILDVGAGPGLLAVLLDAAGFSGRYLGIDPDPRKIERARRWPKERAGASGERRFRDGGLDALGVLALGGERFDRVVLIDVLYLVPPYERPAFLAACAGLLAERGRLIVTTSGSGPMWKRAWDRLQERVSVELLGRIRGATVAPMDGAALLRLVEQAGLEEVVAAEIGAGYLHGFALVSGRRGGL